MIGMWSITASFAGSRSSIYMCYIEALFGVVRLNAQYSRSSFFLCIYDFFYYKLFLRRMVWNYPPDQLSRTQRSHVWVTWFGQAEQTTAPAKETWPVPQALQAFPGSFKNLSASHFWHFVKSAANEPFEHLTHLQALAPDIVPSGQAVHT